MTENEPKPLTAYDGGRKVLNAISEVLNAGGSAERAMKAGRAALDDLRPSVADLPFA